MFWNRHDDDCFKYDSYFTWNGQHYDDEHERRRRRIRRSGFLH